MVGQNVPLPTESAKQTLLTPIVSAASAAVDTKKGGIFDAHAMDDNDKPRLSETDHRTGWKKEFKSGTYRGVLYGTALRDYPKQGVSLAKAKSVPANMCEVLSWAQRHYRIDVTASTVQRKTGEPTSIGPCPGGDTRITVEAMHTRERHIALIVELTLILICVRCTIFSRQHVQHLRTVMKSLRIVH